MLPSQTALYVKLTDFDVGCFDSDSLRNKLPCVEWKQCSPVEELVTVLWCNRFRRYKKVKGKGAYSC